MKKRLLVPITARPHRARMQLLIQELKKHFIVELWEPKPREGNMSVSSIFYAIEFNNYLAGKKFDAIIIRGDRYELLMISAVSAYKGIPIIHIEGGDESGKEVVDSKVRHSITALASSHFATNKESLVNLIKKGTDPDLTFNFGSLDVEFASKVKPKKIRTEPYILVAYHPVKNEDESELDKALENFKDYEKIVIKSNKDYGRGYGAEQFSPSDYINLMRYAKCLVGNSSSLLKEASVLGVPVVLVGNRQKNRLMPHNLVQVPCEADKIDLAIEFQTQNKYKKDLLYFQSNTSKKICTTLKKLLSQESTLQ